MYFFILFILSYFVRLKMNLCNFMRITAYYEQKYLKSCYGHSYENHLTLSSAQSACDSDLNCVAVYDVQCDNKGVFSLCPKSVDLDENYVSSCVYVKTGGLTFYFKRNFQYFFVSSAYDIIAWFCNYPF